MNESDTKSMIQYGTRWTLRTLGVLVCAMIPVIPAGAQYTASGSVGVSAVITGALSVTTQDELSFGTLTAPYASRRVQFTDNGPLGRRGRFTIVGEGNAELVVELTVPDAMRNAGRALPLADWGMRVNTVDADVGGADYALATGRNATTLRMPASTGGSSQLFIRLSATARPDPSQAAGRYGATVQVSLTYVGA
jgi:spore coat protein U-like protein